MSVPDSPMGGGPAPMLVKSPESTVTVIPDEWRKPIRLGDLESVLKTRDLSLEYRIIRTMTETEETMSRLYRFRPDKDGVKRDRYKEILPFGENRVLLSDKQYINASYMPNCDGSNPKAYIASQGPLQSTIGHQWDIIWDHKVPLVMTIGNLMEGTTEKCAQYWPTNANDEIKVLGPGGRVFLVKCTNFSDIENNSMYRRDLQVRYNDSTLELVHYHFHAWPDHGSLDPVGMIAIAKALKGDRSLGSAPILVHCSAGVGRTGCVLTFANCVEAIEKQMSSTGRGISDCFLSIMDTLLSLRRNRIFIVERTWQYESVYASVLEIVKRGKLP
jgi:protein tyrosine phosphatase